MGMAGRGLALVLVVAAAALQLSYAAVYKVGDSAGWTTIGNVDYNKWAASKTFHVGDIIVFQYHANFHNVMRVKHAEYQTCNVSTTPLATFTTGNDSYTVSSHGHHYFLCGVPGHCQAGQKVDINVARETSLLAPTPSAMHSPSSSPSSSSSSSSSSAPGGAPVPTSSDTAPLDAWKGLLSKLGFAMAVFAVLVSTHV